MQAGGKNEKMRFRDLAVEVAAGGYAVWVVLFFWEQPAWTFGLLAAGLGLQLGYWRNRLDAAVMAWAALIGVPAEMLCVKAGLWSYHAPGLWGGVPLWLPLVWAYLIGLFRRFSLTLLDLLHGFSSSPQAPGLRLLFGFLGTLALGYSVVAVILIGRVFAVSFTLAMIPVVVFRHRRRDIMLFITGAVFGTLGEWACMKLGFWHYHNPYFKGLGMPLSLPLAWGLSSIIIVSLAEKWGGQKSFAGHVLQDNIAEENHDFPDMGHDGIHHNG